MDKGYPASGSSPSASTAPSCANGCGRKAFGKFRTCCTHCKGPDGPHAKDCEAKSAFRSAGGIVTIRVLHAKLFRSFDAFGKMDPFCKVEWSSGTGSAVHDTQTYWLDTSTHIWSSTDPTTKGPSDRRTQRTVILKGSGVMPCDRSNLTSKSEVGRTKSHWGGHMEPKWDHMCKPMEYSGSGSGDRVAFSVLEENLKGMGTPTFCGSVVVTVDELIRSADTVSDCVMATQDWNLPLIKRDEVTGTLTVQIVVNKSAGAGTSDDFTPVDSSRFMTPVQRLGVSGGTAPFFGLKLKSPEAGKSVDHWIGKDLSRATDEISFYEDRNRLIKHGGHGLDRLFDYMFEYAGVLECAEAGVAADAPKLQLLVLRNLRDGCKNLRMLDIKIGEKTAAANWQGKSRLSALRQSLVDSLTNSAAEGYRLEGFDGLPPALKSMDPLIDTQGGEVIARKKAQRMMLQRMPAADMFMNFMDVHKVPEDTCCKLPDDTSTSLEKRFSSVELAEIVMAEIVVKLAHLAVACRSSPVPQKWIGSSVALGFDDKTLPHRGTSEKDIVRTVLVNIFDWGRSELNTLENHAELSATNQADRVQYWKYYCGGIDRLAWEAARFFWHRFCNTSDWGEWIWLEVWDFDSFTASDFMGQVQVPLKDTARRFTELMTSSGDVVKVDGESSQLEYAIEWRSLPGTRLKGSWRISIFSATNLPIYDGIAGKSDPYVKVVATKDQTFHTYQTTVVIPSNLNPVWNEIFDLPISRSMPHALHTFFEALMKELAKLEEEQAKLAALAEKRKQELDARHAAHKGAGRNMQTTSVTSLALLFPGASSDLCCAQHDPDRSDAEGDQIAMSVWSRLLRAYTGRKSFFQG